MNDAYKEAAWKERRLGNISASELNSLFSASGKMIDGNVDYIRHKRFERKHGFVIPVSAKAFDIGHEQEPYAVEWMRHHYPLLDIVYSMEQESIPFWTVPELRFGASPDAYTRNKELIIEVKTVVGVTATEYWDDESIPYAKKKAQVMSEHGRQLAGQLLTCPEAEQIWLIKYTYQNDDIDADMDSPLADWRGHVFMFDRSEFDLDGLRERIELFNGFIDSDKDAEDIKDAYNAALAEKKPAKKSSKKTEE